LRIIRKEWDIDCADIAWNTRSGKTVAHARRTYDEKGDSDDAKLIEAHTDPAFCRVFVH
jgi:hypothetical protein